MYFRRKTSAGRAYLQIVESHRDGDQVTTRYDCLRSIAARRYSAAARARSRSRMPEQGYSRQFATASRYSHRL